MSKLRYIAIIGLILTSLFAFDNVQLSENPVALPFNGKFFTTDNLGNLFLINKDNSITKYDKNGVKKAIANFKIQGNISQLDVSNPFEIYAYFQDQQTVLILDNQLSKRATIPLNNISTGEITAACRSFDNGIWYFNSGNMKLYRTDKTLSNKKESLPMASWTSESWAPTQLLDNVKNLFMHDPKIGIAVFDVFGNYHKTIQIQGLSDLQVKGDNLYFLQNGYYQRFDFKFRSYDTLFHMPESKTIRMETGQLFEWKSDSIYIHDIQKQD
jgi:hypothetical protein